MQCVTGKRNDWLLVVSEHKIPTDVVYYSIKADEIDRPTPLDAPHCACYVADSPVIT